jgi:hypothetical protein
VFGLKGRERITQRTRDPEGAEKNDEKKRMGKEKESVAF